MRSLSVIAALTLCAACSAPEEEGETPTGQATEAGATASEDAPAERVALSGTAWRVEGEDGAIYTTYLDADGTYRDFKNGEPLQDGSWEELSEKRLCFSPSSEEARGECWDREPQDSDGTMRATSDSGLTVELRQVTYIAANES